MSQTRYARYHHDLRLANVIGRCLIVFGLSSTDEDLWNLEMYPPEAMATSNDFVSNILNGEELFLGFAVAAAFSFQMHVNHILKLELSQEDASTTLEPHWEAF